MDIFTAAVKLYLSGRCRAIASYPEKAREMQEKVLHRLLRQARNTEWGRKYGFGDMKDYSDFAAKVPLSIYDDIHDDIERMRYGAKDVLWKGRVKYFAKSSGTTAGRSKFIPVTGRGLRKVHIIGGKDVTAVYTSLYPETRMFHGDSVILCGSFDPENCTPYSKCGDVSAIMTSSIPSVFRNMLGIRPPISLALIKSFEQKREALANYLIHRNVTSISGVPSWWLSVLTRMLEITGKATIDEIWPGIEMFAHGGVGFTPYRELYKKMIPTPKMHYIETYNASEGFFGVQDDPSDPAMLLMVDHDIFYEFVPMSGPGRKEARPVPLWEVEPGIKYAMVISTSCGLWRYMIGDTVRFTGKDPYKFVISGRTHQFINAFGEELIVENAEMGLEIACRRTGAQVREYTAAPVYMDSHAKCRHQWMVEFAHKPSSLEDFTRELDDALRSLNSDYDAKRFKDIVLDRLEVIEARPGLFHDWMGRRGKLGGQHKVPRLANSREFIEPLIEMNK